MPDRCPEVKRSGSVDHRCTKTAGHAGAHTDGSASWSERPGVFVADASTSIFAPQRKVMTNDLTHVDELRRRHHDLMADQTRLTAYAEERPRTFLEHAIRATSQYDAQYRSMATEILFYRDLLTAQQAALEEKGERFAEVMNQLIAALKELDETRAE